MNERVAYQRHLADEAVIDLGALRRIYEDRVIDEFIIGGRAPLQPNHPNPARWRNTPTTVRVVKTPWRRGVSWRRRFSGVTMAFMRFGEVPNVLLAVEDIGACEAVVHHGLGKGQERLIG